MKTKAIIKKYGWMRVRLVSAFIVLVFVLAPAQHAEAQLTLGARGASMGQAVTALQTDSWSVFSNPAMLPSSGNAASFYGIRNYGFSELTDVALSGHYAHAFGTSGIGLHTYGDDLFRESRFRAAHMYEYSGIRVGLITNYTHVSIENYGSAGTLTLDAGIAYSIIEGLWVGARATNMNRGQIGEAREELPRELAVGVAYTLSDRATVSSDVVKDARFPMAYRGGLEVRIFEELYLRGGITTEPLTYSVGMGYNHSSFGVNIVAQQHYVLGWSPGLDFSVNF
ncbi:MAG: hypothetical protein LAT84_02675 [Balneolia bacterium]|nr:hypothetical protein [Balneolia bacterium]